MFRTTATVPVITRLDRVILSPVIAGLDPAIQYKIDSNTFLLFRVLFLAARKVPKEPRPAALAFGCPRSKNFSARK